MYKNVFMRDLRNIYEETLSEYHDLANNIAVPTPAIIKIAIPDIIKTYIAEDIIQDNVPNFTLRDLNLHLPVPDGQLEDILSYGTGVIKNDVDALLRELGHDELLRIYTTYLTEVNLENSYLDELLATRLTTVRAGKFSDLVVVYVMINGLLRQEYIGNIHVDTFNATLSRLKTLITYRLSINLKEYEDLLSSDTVITNNNKNIVVIEENLNKLINNNDVPIEVILGTYLLNSDKTTYTVEELLTLRTKLEELWDSYYDKTIMVKRTEVSRLINKILVEKLDVYIEASESVKKWNKNKQPIDIKRNVYELINKVNVITEDNIEDIIKVIFTDILYEFSGFGYFLLKIKTYTSKSFGFDLDKAITVAIGDIVTEIITRDIRVR
jgi:hypothetical protein